MLTELYIEALLVDEELADLVWETWDAGEINDLTAWLAWRMVYSLGTQLYGVSEEYVGRWLVTRGGPVPGAAACRCHRAEREGTR